MQLKHLEGLIAAPFTPMERDGSLNLTLVSRYYEMLKLNRITGAFICGSTGEGVSLTIKERKQVVETWATVTEGDENFPVIVLVGGTSINECIDLAKHAERAGLEAIAFTAPFYFKPADIKSLAKICMAVSESVPNLPFYYYHIPVLTGVNFPMIDLLKEIDGMLPNFAGIKYTHEDFMDYLSCLHFKNGKYDMLWGRDENMLPALSVGAKGSVGSTFNYAAPLYHDLIHAFNSGDLPAAREKQQQAIDMIGLLGKYGGIATGKTYMKMIGLDCGEFRLPVKNMTTDQYEHFKKDVEKLSFSGFASQLPSGIKI